MTCCVEREKREKEKKRERKRERKRKKEKERERKRKKEKERERKRKKERKRERWALFRRRFLSLCRCFNPNTKHEVFLKILQNTH